MGSCPIIMYQVELILYRHFLKELENCLKFK
jgi:hypothetical protein